MVDIWPTALSIAGEVSLHPERAILSRRFRIVYVVTALLTVGVLTRLVKSGKTAELDATVTLAVQRQSNGAFSRLMHIASWAGFPPQSRTLPFLIPALIALFGRRVDAAFQLAGWGTSGISFVLKRFMKRPRPVAGRFRVIPARIGGTSFPSGHVINYTGVYGMLAYLAGQHVKHPLLRRGIVGFLVSKIVLVGPSRIYLGHHWFTDVVTS
ncbi:MAG: phosphatase PAP2 family protein, partial [Thermomicrobiales bacterium]|nr:phosphatase PAP2 family protein [Thermomicrobiales bacterium]